MTDVALGIDVGTGSTKAGLVDADGRLLATARRPHRIDAPQPGWSETDPHRWLDSAGGAVRELVAAHRQNAVVAVGVAGQMHGVVLCDADGRPVRPAVLWPDQRAEPRLRRWAGTLAPRLAALANPLVPGMAGPILGVLADDEANTVRRSRWALQPKDWFRLWLTGEVATDPSDASATLLWDTVTQDWSAEAAHAFGVDPTLLPPVRASDTPAGRLRGPAAEVLGLPAGLPVVTGAADTAAALLGAGIATAETQVSTGTGGQIAVLLDAPRPDPTCRTHLYRAAGTGWYAMAAIQNAGLAIDWALGVLGAGYADAGEAVAATPAGARGVTFLPYLSGERTPHLDSGMSGAWVGLRPDVDRAALIRAVFEGVAFALRDGLDALREVGHPIGSALLAGGGSHARWWRQLLADALAIPLTPHNAADGSVRGAALLAWRGVGIHPHPGDHVTRGATVTPGVEDLGPALQRFRDHASRTRRSH